jgi:hypothetical protein
MGIEEHNPYGPFQALSCDQVKGASPLLTFPRLSRDFVFPKSRDKYPTIRVGKEYLCGKVNPNRESQGSGSEKKINCKPLS